MASYCACCSAFERVNVGATRDPIVATDLLTLHLHHLLLLRPLFLLLLLLLLGEVRVVRRELRLDAGLLERNGRVDEGELVVVEVPAGSRVQHAVERNRNGRRRDALVVAVVKEGVGGRIVGPVPSVRLLLPAPTHRFLHLRIPRRFSLGPFGILQGALA